MPESVINTKLNLQYCILATFPVNDKAATLLVLRGSLINTMILTNNYSLARIPLIVILIITEV